MSCIKKIKSEEISGSTFQGREFSLTGDITDYSFIAKVKSPFQGKITEILGIKNASKVFFSFESIKDLRNGKYIIEYWGDFDELGNEPFLVEELSIVSAEKSSGNCSNETHIFDVKINNITIPISLDFSVVNIYNNSGSYAWGDIGGDIENQADLIKKFGNYYTKTETYNKNEVDSLISNIDVYVDLSNYYTKPQSDARFKSISYTPNWSEVSGKPTTFSPSAHTHTIAEIDNLQTALNGKEPIISIGTTSQYFRGDKTWQIIDKSTVGLNNVDNTSDANKPISTATQNALNLKADKGLNIKITTPSNWVTGTVAETEVLRIEIPANSLSDSDVLRIPFLMINKLGTNGTIFIRGKLSTSATMTSGTKDQIFQTAIVNATNLFVGLDRSFIIYDGKLKGFPDGIPSYTSSTISSSSIQSIPFDRTVTNYFYVSITLASSADKARLEGMQLTNN